ncbi:uncharacterized protein LOC134843446 isoform X2 [Symsagittifera roscoffensis]
MMARRRESTEREKQQNHPPPPPNPGQNYKPKNGFDPSVLDKLNMHIDALERELEKERKKSQLLKQDKDRLKEAVTELQMRENERMHNGTTQSSGSDSDEVSQLKAALESAKKERMALQEDRERERKMFIENNARGDRNRVEMMDLKKDFDDMQAAVLQLQHELKLRNETIVDLQQQLIFFQNLDKKKSDPRYNESESGGGKPGRPTASAKEEVGGESPVYECSRCHQYFQDMSQFQGHITHCLEFRLFHSKGRSKSVEPLSQPKSQLSTGNLSKPSPFPSSTLGTDKDSGSAILTKYSYDSLRLSGLTNSSSQLKITAIDSRHEHPGSDRGRANSIGGPKVNRRGPVQKGINQAFVYDQDRGKAFSNPHLSSHQKQNSMGSSMGGFDSDWSDYNSANNLNISTEPESSEVKDMPQIRLELAGNMTSNSSVDPENDEIIKPVVRLKVSSAPRAMSSPVSTSLDRQNGKGNVQPVREQTSRYDIDRSRSPQAHPASDFPNNVKFPPAQNNNQIRHLGHVNHNLKARNSPAISSSSSDGVRSASINLREEVLVRKDQPDSAFSQFSESMSSMPLQKPIPGNRGAIQNPLPVDDDVNRRKLMSPNCSSDESDRNGVAHEDNNAEARRMFLEASKPGAALQDRINRKEAQVGRPLEPLTRGSLLAEPLNVEKGLIPSMQIPGFSPIENPNQLDTARHIISPTINNVLEDSQLQEIEPHWPGERRYEPAHSFQADMHKRLLPPKMDKENPNAPRSSNERRRSIKFEENERLVKGAGYSGSRPPSGGDVRRPNGSENPSSILKNKAPEGGMQIVDNLGPVEGSSENGMDPPKRGQKNNSFQRGYESDSNNSGKMSSDKENSLNRSKQSNRSKSPSFKNFRNRFFSNSDDKKEKDKHKDKKNNTQAGKSRDKRGSRPSVMAQSPSPVNDSYAFSGHEQRGRPMNSENSDNRGRYRGPQGPAREQNGFQNGPGPEQQIYPPPQHRPQFSAEMRVGIPTGPQYRPSRVRSQPPVHHGPTRPQNAEITTDV